MKPLQSQSKRDAEIERLRTLVIQGLAVVDDFMPNIGRCVLQDYGRLNSFCLEARKLVERKRGRR